MIKEAILDAIEQATGTRPRGTPATVSGGCIHQSYQLGDFFIKTNVAEKLPVFEAEKVGLEALAETKTARVPEVICTGTAEETAYLVLEFLDLSGPSSTSQHALGLQLAALHRHTNKSFGFSSDNFIGETPQPNQPASDWVIFFRESRLQHMGQLLERAGQGIPKLDLLLDQLDLFFTAHTPEPALLHGDLWGGNAGTLSDGTPVIYDPAVYFGDREADIAMTTLFGGFSAGFYEAYNEIWPLDPGYEQRRDLYNLYHLLNHAVLFGGSYHKQAEKMITNLLGRRR